MKNLFIVGLLAMLLAACGGSKYEVRGDVVVRSEWTFSFGTVYDTLPGADPATFKQVKDWLGHDSERVYFEAKLVPGVDVLTLEPQRYPLFRDKNDYYYKTVPLHVADRASFQVIKWFDDDFWAKDSRNAYYDSLRIDGVDVPSLALDDRRVARDKYHVYMRGVLLPEADPATFEHIAGSLCYRDKSHVWNLDKLLVGADPATFELVGDNYFRDKSHVWYEVNESPLEGADPASFEVIGNSQYSRDKSHIWFRDKLLPDADRATFAVDPNNGSFASDKNGTFTGDRRDNDPVEP